MTKQNTSNTRSFWVLLSIILAVIAILHLQYLDIPLERDESLYAYLGKIALGGGTPYYDFYEMKPPMLFYSYALLIGLFGYSATGVHLAVVALAVANTFFTFQIARKIGGIQVAYLSAIAFGLWSLNPGIQGVYLMSENVALLWGLPAILMALDYHQGLSTKRLFAIGLLLSLAFLVKQTAGVFAASVGLYWLTIWFTDRKTIPFAAFIKPLVWTILGFIVPIIAFVVTIWAMGSLNNAIFWLTEYPNHYASSVTNENAWLALQLMQNLSISGYEGYFIAALLGAFALVFLKKEAPLSVFLISWMVLATFTVAIGTRFYGHYWLLALPVLSILGVLFFTETSRWLGQKMSRIESSIVLIIGLIWSLHALFLHPSIYFNPELTDISQKYAPGNAFVEDKILSNYVEKILKPTDRIAVFGSDEQFFIYLQKTSPFRHVFMPFIIKDEFKQVIGWQNETVEALKNTKPEYVIFNNYPYAWLYPANANVHFYNDILQEIKLNYDLVAFIENPGKNKNIQVKEPTNGGRIPGTPSYISVLKRH